jgi:hypothetical protein
MNRVVRVLMAIVLCGGMTGAPLGGLVARAEPGPAVAEPGGTPSIAWTQLGRPDQLEVLGSNQVFDTDIPVPQGLTPGVLRGTVGSVVNVVDGRVDVVDERGVVLGSIPLLPDNVSAPFTVDISRAIVSDGAAKLGFVIRDHNPPQNSCSQPPSLTLSQLAASYRGTAPYPGIVADFLPDYLDRFVIRTGAAPSPATQQGVLDLVARLTRHYRPVPVRIDVDASSEPAAKVPPGQRVIELRDGGPAGMTVTSPNSPRAALVIAGHGDELARQIALFADRRFTLAQTLSATVNSATIDVPQSSTVKTFAQLGITGQTSVLGNATLYVGLDVSQFAVGSLQQATLHLIGHYTPVVGGEASVVVRSGNAVLVARRLDESGLLDITETIPAESIQSNVGVALALRYLPSQPCVPLNNRIQFALDPASTVSVTPGTFNRGGFPALPMAFAPGFDVVVDQPDHLRFAAAAVNLMAQQTALTLRPRITTMAAGAASGRGLLVVADGKALTSAGFAPPVTPGPGTTVGIGGSVSTDVDLRGPIGVVQVFTQHDRKVLALSGTQRWTLVERSFDHIRALPARWASLSGDVVATGTAGETVNLTLHEGGVLIDEFPGTSWKRWAQLTGGVAVGVLLAATGVLMWRRRQARHG